MAQDASQNTYKILAELQSIRDLLGEKYFEPPLQPHLIHPEAIPLLSEVVDFEANSTTAPSLPDTSSETLKEQLRLEAPQILQEVITAFLPQIETELHKRLQQKLDDLIQSA